MLSDGLLFKTLNYHYMLLQLYIEKHTTDFIEKPDWINMYDTLDQFDHFIDSISNLPSPIKHPPFIINTGVIHV